MKTALNNLGWTILGTIAFLFLRSYLKKKGWDYLGPFLTFFLPFALAWMSDIFLPSLGREVRDIIVGICGAQWLVSLFREL